MRVRIASLSLVLAVVAGHAVAAQPNDDAILRAAKTEVDRARKQLALEAMTNPYYVEAAVTDALRVELVASFGALTRNDVQRARPFRVAVRVGNYDLDSSEFVSTRSYSRSTLSSGRLVLDDDEVVLRRDLWLAFDAAYKQALEQLANKKAVLQTRVVPDQVPDFSKEAPITAVSEPAALKIDLGPWADRVKKLSALFRQYPVIQESNVTLRVTVANQYLVTSEGTVIRQPEALASLLVRARTQASDGMELKDFVPFFAPNLASLPDEASITAAIKAMADQLTASAAAPVVEKYIGPVLFSGHAAAELFAQLLAPQLSGHRPPLYDDERFSSMASRNEFADRLGRQVLPTFLTVIDDPTRGQIAGQRALGGYVYDDQGVPAQAVTLVEAGVLKSLVMSRRPRKEIAQSNGHGRIPGQGGGITAGATMVFSAAGASGPTATTANLLISSSEGKSLPELERELIALCKQSGQAFGLLVTKLDEPAASAIDSLRSFAATVMGGSGNRKSLVAPPLVVFRVWADDGHKEVVRGLVFGEISVKTLREISLSGSDVNVVNRMTPAVFGAGTSTAAAISLGGGGVNTVAAPSVLIPELELSRPTGPQQKTAVLPHPYFGK
jgi:TldD protein